MSESNSSEFVSKFKNYSLNLLILFFAAASIYLIYNFINRITAAPVDVRKEFSDTTSNYLTRQPSKQTLQIDVQNGSGVQGIANKFTDYLRANGFDVVEIGNFSTSDINTTMVIDRTGNLKNAKKVALALGISEKYVIQQISKEYFLDATVVIGKDYEELNPFKDRR
ncbi:MAG: LytR C-terminal domain-containing protein [Ignavibacteria bacterium]